MKLSDYANKLGVSYLTAYLYWKKGYLKGRQLPTGTIIIEEEKTENTIQHNRVVLYARVSSSENQDNLKSQLQRLREYAIAKHYTIVSEISEIGSGLNDKRKKLLKIFTNSNWDIILIEHKDRLARFGVELIESLLNQLNKRIEIINQAETQKEDILQDLISIITSYSAKIYGLRRSKRKTEAIISHLQSNAKTPINTKKNSNHINKTVE